MVVLFSEQRAATRRLESSPFWFKEKGESQFHLGWLIERSDVGAAFLARSGAMLLPGAHVVASSTNPYTDPSFLEEGLVARVKSIHADLWLVGAQLKPFDAGDVDDPDSLIRSSEWTTKTRTAEPPETFIGPPCQEP